MGSSLGKAVLSNSIVEHAPEIRMTWRGELPALRTGYRESKSQLQRQLKLTRILRAGDSPKVSRERRTVRDIEIRVVEEIVGFGAKLQPRPLAERDLLLQGEIEFAQSGANHRVSRSAPESEQCGQ